MASRNSAKTETPETPVATAMAKTKLEKFETIEVDRTTLKGATYNPREISPGALRRLKKGINKLGMLAPITWNRRSGNIVGGHQRLKIMDAQAGGALDYRLTVAAVDLNDIEEREANLLLNNEAAMGMFVVDALTDVLKTEGLDLEGTGWESADLISLIGEDPTKESVDEEDAVASASVTSGFGNDREKYREVMEKFNALATARADEGVGEFYLVFVFPSRKKRVEFTDAVGLPDEIFQSSEDLIEMTGANEEEEGDGDDADADSVGDATEKESE